MSCMYFNIRSNGSTGLSTAVLPQDLRHHSISSHNILVGDITYHKFVFWLLKANRRVFQRVTNNTTLLPLPSLAEPFVSHWRDSSILETVTQPYLDLLFSLSSLNALYCLKDLPCSKTAVTLEPPRSSEFVLLDLFCVLYVYKTPYYCLSDMPGPTVLSF